MPEDLLSEPKEFAGHYDPHIWFDVSMWAQTVPTIIKGLSEVDPASKEIYENNGAALMDRLANFINGAKRPPESFLRTVEFL